jgi:excisionase family DNA binding protein
MSKTIKPLIKKNDIDVSEYMNVTELSKLLKMSTSHIYSLTSTKKIPHIKLLGKKILFDKSEINNWLKSKSVSAN